MNAIQRVYLRTDTREEMETALSAAGIEVDAESGEFPTMGPGFDLFDVNANGCAQNDQYHVNVLMRDGLNPALDMLAAVEIYPVTPWATFA